MPLLGCYITMGPTTAAGQAYPSQTDLAGLQADCLSQMERFRQEHANDPTPCLTLFRQAILHRDPAAWEALLSVYRPYIQQWVRRRGVIADTNLVDEMVQDATVRFWRAYTPEQFSRARSLADILRYWQDCAATAYFDWLRRGRNAPDALEETDDGTIPKELVTDALPENLMQAETDRPLLPIVVEQCPDEADMVIAPCVLVEGQKPRNVLREHPDHFESIEQIYKRLRNIKDRLRRNPRVLELLEAR